MLLSMICFNSKAMTTNHNNYSCHIKAVARIFPTSHMQSISHHVMVLVFNNLKDEDIHIHTHEHTHTHTHTHKHTYTHMDTHMRAHTTYTHKNFPDKSNFKKLGTRLV